MKAKVPKWESELWSYISRGDGENCALYSHCQDRLSGKWCISENKELVELLLRDSHKRLPDTDDAPVNYDTVIKFVDCKIFNLVDTLAQSFVRKGKVRCPPVPSELASMADERYPIEIRLIPLARLSGAIWGLKESWVIQLNRNDPPNIRRFSLFHEAFHILAHCRADPVFKKRGGRSGAFNELLAEYFASCVLMPTKWVSEHWSRIKDVDKMAEVFEVPELQMWLKLKSLGLI
ncbi:MAG: ImmA/IrrE family metallo-endopeptidase [Chloroflexota bacterium]|nr:MAG: ImmA/IrrE family metallo-endopeptidase [Chloroflexota bacterium]